MFCQNCGSEIKENDRFCPACGAPVADQEQASGINVESISINQSGSSKNILDILRGSKRMIAAIVAIVLVVIISFTVFGGYKAVMRKYFKAIVKADGDLYYSLLADDYLDYMMSGWGYTEKELRERYQESMEDALYSIQKYCGSKVTVRSREITDVYKASASEISQLNSWLESNYWFEEDSIKNAVVVSYKLELTGPEGSCTYSGERLVIKSHGKWCLTGGTINLSWYSQ